MLHARPAFARPLRCCIGEIHLTAVELKPRIVRRVPCGCGNGAELENQVDGKD
jgi:hypothetical protein